MRNAVCIFLLLAATAPAFGHLPDTSYARFKVGPERFEAKFSYDLAALERIAPGLDANGDRQVTDAELQAQAPAVSAFLREHVRLEIDGAKADWGQPQPVVFPPGNGPAIAESQYHNAGSLVNFVFVHRLAQPMADFWVQFDLFAILGQRHTVLGAIEQGGKEQEVLFRDTEPDYLYDTGYLPSAERKGLASAEATAPSPAAEEGAKRPRSTGSRSNDATSAWQQMGSFFRLGVEHIFLGYDHILFLLSLLVVSRFGELVKIVTSFTAAHTITLILAALEVVQVPSRLVETAIAATIVYVALENFWVKSTAHRWRLTFFCGLVHGFGFAGVLRELGLPTEGLVRSLISFNVGVEAGQLMIVTALLPVVTLLARWAYRRPAQDTISAAIATCGGAWFIDRAFALGFMPF